MSAHLAQALPFVTKDPSYVFLPDLMSSPSHCVVLCWLMGAAVAVGGCLMRACEALRDCNHDRGGYTNKLDLLRRTECAGT